MAKNNKTRFFYVLYSDKTRVFDQSERAYYPIYIIKIHICYFKFYFNFCWRAEIAKEIPKLGQHPRTKTTSVLILHSFVSQKFNLSFSKV